MTSVDDVSKLRALQRARDRLETALATDEGWQALLQSHAMTGEDGGESASLEAGLLRSNPLYRAWSNVNAAIEARQRGGPPKASGAAPAYASTSASDLVSSRDRAQGADAGRAPAGQREQPRQCPPSETEASVSFVALAPSAPTHQRQLQHLEALRAPTGLPAVQDHEPAAGAATGATAGGGGEEAEVLVVSVDARRHAGAVDRLLRALRGETNPS